MDQVKTGKLIAALRKEAGLTQEALGEKLGVTNKTVSRWENGNYMPDIEMLELLSKELGVSIHELLTGERPAGEAFRRKADEEIVAAVQSGAFSFEERKEWLKKKWRREHRFLLLALLLLLAAAIVLPLLLHKPWLAGLAPLLAFVEYGYQNNKMLAYVEQRLYGQ